MPIDIGNELYTPLLPSGNVEDGVFGCFPQNSSSGDMNIENPEPGMVYMWERLDEGSIRAAEHRGWEVDLTNPKRSRNSRAALRATQIGYDSATVRVDVILMRMPEDVHRQVMAEEDQKALARRQDPADLFLRSNEQRSIQERYGSGARGPIAFRYPQHGLQALDKNPDF